MNNNFKTLEERVSEKMAADLKRGISVFQKPDNSLNSAMPFNIESGHRYTGAAALTLLMQRRDDPRWATFKQANRNRTAVLPEMTGTFINFYSSYAIRKTVNDRGEAVLRENGSQRTEKVKLKEPELVEAKVFNGEQLRKLAKWEKEPVMLSPVERAELILENSKAVVEHGGDDMLYDLKSDTIVLPEKEQFASPEQYYAEALHQLAHRTAELQINQPKDGVDQWSNSKLELRTNLSSLFMSKELNLPYDLNYHAGYVNSWAQIMKEEPGELYKAAADAQKIADRVLGLEYEQEQKQEAEAEKAQEQPVRENPVAEAYFDSGKLNKGEVIPYDGKDFKVVSELKNKVYNMQDLSDGRKFKMSSKDALFSNLLEARNSSQEKVMAVEHDQRDRDESFEQEENQGYSMSM